MEVYAYCLLKNHYHLFIKTPRANLSRAKINQVLGRIEATLKKLSEISVERKIGTSRRYFSPYRSSDKLLVFTGKRQLDVIACDFSLRNCNREEFARSDYSLLLSGRYKNSDGDAYLFLGTDQESYISGVAPSSLPDIGGRVTPLRDGAKLISYGALSADINQKEKTVKLRQQKSGDRALIVGGELRNWTIIFQGIAQKTMASGQRFNDNLLTGCLTFLDISLVNLRITVMDAPGEDGVNFVRTTGSENSVHVTNALSDAIDVDFSTMTFKDVIVTTAGNDCIDFSAGRYHVLNAVLKHCGDKAVSVGEGSITAFSSIDVTGAGIGVAVKDSSSSDIGIATFSDVETCLTATNKKQEYWGGKIKVGKLKCPSGTNFQQDGSLIEVGQ